MNVAEVIAELSKLPGHLPVKVAVEIETVDDETYTDFAEANEVKWQGAWVEIDFE